MLKRLAAQVDAMSAAGIPVGAIERDRAMIARLQAELRKAFPWAVAKFERRPRLPRPEKAGSTI